MDQYKLEDYDFFLENNLIATRPQDRGTSKFLIIKGNKIIDEKFSSIINFLDEGDILILNNTKVLKSKFCLKKNNSIIELFIIDFDQNKGVAMAKPGRKINKGDVFDLEGGKIFIEDKQEDGKIYIRFHFNFGSIEEFINNNGTVPLPLYMKRNAQGFDEDSYQTVYAKELGSLASPTAGLHFSSKLLQEIKNKGINIEYVTLHIGSGTFLPIKTDINSHKMHQEKCYIDKNLKNKIIQAKNNKKKIIAVGTTVVRVLESAFLYNCDGYFSTNLFIKEGFKFSIVDMLVTNFHLPKSTLLILVSSFGGKENIFKAYQHAIQNKYKFFSYGDSCLIYNKLYV